MVLSVVCGGHKKVGKFCIYAWLILGKWVTARWHVGVPGMNVSGCECIRDCVGVGLACLGL